MAEVLHGGNDIHPFQAALLYSTKEIHQGKTSRNAENVLKQL